MPFEDVGRRADCGRQSHNVSTASLMSYSVTSAKVCESRSSFQVAGWIWTAKAPTSQHLALRNMTNIEHRSQFQLHCKICVHQKLKDWENGVQTRPDCVRYPMSQKTAYYRPTTTLSNTGGEHGRSDCDQLYLASCQQEIHCLDLCLLGACLLVTSVSLVASCKKWTCPPDNHARTFDMSGDILACLGHTDWPYFEPWRWVQKQITENSVYLIFCRLK